MNALQVMDRYWKGQILERIDTSEYIKNDIKDQYLYDGCRKAQTALNVVYNVKEHQKMI